MITIERINQIRIISKNDRWVVLDGNRLKLITKSYNKAEKKWEQLVRIMKRDVMYQEQLNNA